MQKDLSYSTEFSSSLKRILTLSEQHRNALSKRIPVIAKEWIDWC